MTQTAYDGGGGGGGSTTPDSGVCSITPSDLVGATGNAINRLLDLEQRVAELEAKIVSANQLSDLSQQVGWVGGVTYMGVDGWTQTEYGTLIPPPGVSLSSLGITVPNVGSALQFMVMDENGNLVLGIDELGQLLGTAGTAINAISLSDYAIRDNVTDESRGITVVSGVDNITMTVSKDGIYYAAGAGGAYPGLTVTGKLQSTAGDIMTNTFQDLVGASGNFSFGPSTSGLFKVAAGDSVAYSVSTSPGGAAVGFLRMQMIMLTTY